ncbi:serine hydrolase domain-containing protein [Nocardia mangyaensis]|uniref:serine hydrolase domain-containing protein n=1 Tax=Nocardia mangyaensis TaxID=2213200 RepID=UPI002676142D|nr:serine hydrolase domain-containing protein [Nocardia mangyaensis]MDO3650306.1 serine hydrolase domain-containing protein [Nocardia mangyaensis]
MIILERWLVVLMSGLVLAGCAATPHAAADSSSAALDEFLRERMDEVRIPGAAYAVLDRAGVRHAGTFGTDGSGERVTSATPFLWGSVAKPVTARLVLDMASADELQLDAPVTTYLPSLRMADAGSDRSAARITLRQLLTHTSGLPTSTHHTDRGDANRRPGDVVPELAEEALITEPGTAHHYSSTNYLLLAAVVEAVTGRPFTDVLTERVLDPLGMRTTITTPASSPPPGHRYFFGHPFPFTTPFDPAGVAYGYLGGALGDLAAFARASLTDSPQVDDAVPTGSGRTYGLGWRQWTVEGTDIPMVWHGGATPGYFAQIILLPEHAIVLTANAYGTFTEPALLDLGFQLAARTLNHETSTTPADYTYPAILAALMALAALGITALVRSIRLLIHPITAPHRRVLVNLLTWLFALGTILIGFGIALPRSLGIELTQLTLWAPDVAGLVFTILAVATVLLLLRSALCIRALTSNRTDGPTDAERCDQPPSARDARHRD